MKRKLACIGFPYLLGLLAFSLGWGRYSLVFACLVLLWAAAFVVAKKCYRTYTAVMAFCFFIGVAYGTFYTYTNYNNILKYDGKTVALVAHKAPQLAIEVITQNKSWDEAIQTDWRKTKAWQPGWEYEIK